MSESILVGTNNVSEQDVFNVPAVPYTKTFHPVHHADVIRAIKEAIGIVGMEIVKSEYVLGQDGMRMFGVYDLSQGTSELSWSIGIRNSMNKSMSLGITAGTRVFVCENLCFSGEFLAFRKHTNGLDADELTILAYRSMRNMIPKLTAFQKWHEGLRGYPLTEQEAKILLIEIMTNSVIPASKFHQFNELYANVYDDTLWGFHEATTDVLRGTNLMSLPKKNQVLNEVINNFIYPVDGSGTSPLGDFYEQRCLSQN